MKTPLQAYLEAGARYDHAMRAWIESYHSNRDLASQGDSLALQRAHDDYDRAEKAYHKTKVTK